MSCYAKEGNTTLTPANPPRHTHPSSSCLSLYSHSTLQPQLILPIISLIEARGALRMHTHWARLPAREDRGQDEELLELLIHSALFILPDCKLSSSKKHTTLAERAMKRIRRGESHIQHILRSVNICLVCVCKRERRVTCEGYITSRQVDAS